MSTANRHVTTVSSPNAETIAAALGGRKSGGGWMAHCPVHEDRKPSLSIQEADGGQVLVHCFSGCAQDAILEALRQRGLWPRQPLPSPNQASRPSTTAASKTPPNQPADRSAWELWAHSPAAPGDHPYLVRKHIGAHGARAAGGRLILPLFDAAGTLHGLQSIAGDGEKRFLPGSKITGHWFLIGEAQPAAPCYIAEGFATAATIHEAMGGQAAVAFNAGNLKPAAQALRQQWPERPLVLCADDDTGTTGNPGLAAAREAARAVGGRIAVPGFGADRPEGATDFNDLALSQGPQAVRDSIQQAASAFPTLDSLVAMTIENPGYPFQSKVTDDLRILRTDDPARFEALRAELKRQTQCRLTQLDRTLNEQGPGNAGDASDAGGDSRLADRLAAIAGEALHD